MDFSRTMVMACATVIEEMQPLFPAGIRHQVFDFGLHIFPQKLRETLQAAINEVDDDVDTIILGYGLCSQAVIGIRSDRCTLVVPRVDDCIAIFLGSCAAYKQQASTEPGTYYLTKGWIEVADTPFKDHDRLVERYGEARAGRMMKAMLANYTRLVLINTGKYAMDTYREYTQRTAERFGLRYEEIQGSNELIHQMIHGPWDEGFVVVQPGEEIRYGHFFS